jgi:hypothetical protein
MTSVAVLNNCGDGWICRETDPWLCGDICTTTVLLSGRSFLAEFVAYLIHLEAWLEHSLLKRFTIEGERDFTLPFQIERISEGHQNVLQLKLVADKTTIPSLDSGLPDTRELSVTINAVEVMRK